MNRVSVLGIDLAKSVFQLHGVDERGVCVLKKKLSRVKFTEFMSNFPVCSVAMEATGGSHYWARKFRDMGHNVHLISPQFVKPFLKSNKNDANDAEAICEAVQRPSMRFVAIKSAEQQDQLLVHRIRQRLVRNRTALCNEIRGLLLEYGITLKVGITQVRKQLPILLEDSETRLSSLAKEQFSALYEELLNLIKEIEKYELKIEQASKSEVSQQLMEISGIGPMTATAIEAYIGDAKVFKNGRELSAYFGLVPKQNSSGGKTKLGGISKRGDRYIRTLLVHGARCVVQNVDRIKDEKKKEWIKSLLERRGYNKTIVAVANKNARYAWHAMMVA